MESYKLAVKFFAETGGDIPVEEFVPVFHRWIQGKLLEGHQLIDVANYAHVHEGPGTVLVSHEANIHADLGDGKPGLLYIRKQPGAGTNFRERLRSTFGFALKAASMLEQDPALAGKVSYRTRDPLFLVNDRLHAPNTPETFAKVRGELEAFLQGLYGVKVELRYEPHAERMFQVRVVAPEVKIKALLERVGSA
jgi:hypothetical protein